MKKLNKRGDLSVIIFVSLVLMICIFTLVMFLSHRDKISQNLNGVPIILEARLEQKDHNLILRNLMIECTLKIYSDYFKDRTNTQPNSKDLIEEEFEKYFNENLKICLSSKSKEYLELKDGRFVFFKKEIYEQGEIKKLLERLNDGKINVETKKGDITITLKDFFIALPRLDNQKKNSDISVTIEKDINQTINFKREGLIPPLELISSLEKCLENKECYKNVTKHYFTIEKIDKKNNKTIIELKTIKEYLLVESKKPEEKFSSLGITITLEENKFKTKDTEDYDNQIPQGSLIITS